MSKPRDLVVEALREQLPDVDVLAWPRTLDNVTRPTVLVRLETVEPATDPTGRRLRGHRRYVGALLAVSPVLDTGEGAESDDPDLLLEDVLAVVDRTNGVTWDSAERVLFGAWPTWEVAISYPIAVAY